MPGAKRRPPLRSDRGVKLYAPTLSHPVFRVVLAGAAERTTESVPKADMAAGQSAGWDGAGLPATVAQLREQADLLFDQMVAWAADRRNRPGGDDTAERTVDALCDRRLRQMEKDDLSLNRISNTEGLMRLYIRPAIGQLPVWEWTAEDTREVFELARHLGVERRQDLGRLIRSLATLAHRKPAWLPPDEDPLDGIRYQKKATLHGVDVAYVEPKERPSSRQVESLALAMQIRGDVIQAKQAAKAKPVALDRGWGWLFIQVFGKCGPRFAEVASLVVGSVVAPYGEIVGGIETDTELDEDTRQARIDGLTMLPHGFALDPGSRVITITEVIEWDKTAPHIRPPEEGRSGKPPKNGKRRWTIYPASLTEPLAARCSELLSRFGPDKGPTALLFPAHDHAFVEVATKGRPGRMEWSLTQRPPASCAPRVPEETGPRCHSSKTHPRRGATSLAHTHRLNHRESLGQLVPNPSRAIKVYRTAPNIWPWDQQAVVSHGTA